ncbi:HTH-type transcriptional regulator PuuR [Sporomusa ovata DSM 2662]|uniref:HTH cro/C1-type domain-containing protein n=1 Tax=Sporomusa ovata TaxID=2378 RepID=A0A0U1KXE3_9FIRM|nr:helix-turn-helix transcriptional regulator [Sporomusa ovata]EQB29303.1 transcriptional regulator [Sporomusa ovata DSM 2662]CQR71344.1 hypothetical protein SpAn4DRAFT_3849 [Sporomusa ovata]
MNIGNKIKELRQIKGLSATALASMINTTQQTVSNYEINKTEPSISTIQLICNVFEITLAEFFAEPSNDKTAKETYDEKIKNLPEKDRKIIDTIIEVNKPKEEQAATAEGG